MNNQDTAHQADETKSPTPILGVLDSEEAPKKKMERTYMGKAHTLDGIADVWINETGKYEKIYSELPVFEGFPKKWREKHFRGFAMITGLLKAIKVGQPKRQVPMLMQEITTHVEKEVVKDLEKMGLIGTKLIQLMDKGNKLGGRLIVWITPEGKALEKTYEAIVEEVPPTV
jgi:hypothetical protein